MRIDAVPVGRNPPHDVNVVIEVPIGGEPIKYEMDKAAGTLVVDRFLYTSMRYPGNYGFIPHTLSGDGDPCDVLIANTRAIVPAAVKSVRPVGVLAMKMRRQRCVIESAKIHSGVFSQKAPVLDRLERWKGR
jgi:inorganic pyrophosphatase